MPKQSALVWLRLAQAFFTHSPLGRRCRRVASTNALIGLGWTVVVMALAALGAINAVESAVLHNLGTLAVIINAGRLLRRRD